MENKDLEKHEYTLWATELRKELKQIHKTYEDAQDKHARIRSRLSAAKHARDRAEGEEHEAVFRRLQREIATLEKTMTESKRELDTAELAHRYDALAIELLLKEIGHPVE